MLFLKSSLLEQPYSVKNLALLCAIAFLVRAITFWGYVGHEYRYLQADSLDYHHGALCVTHFNSMTMPNGQPIFWRTPGYPWYLSIFYKLYGSYVDFKQTKLAHKAAIIGQLILCSVVPLLVFFLALVLTNILWIAWLAAWFSVFHLGFVLSATYILSDGLALIPFLLFLCFLYKSFCLYKEPCRTDRSLMFLYTLLAALSLVLFTWIRPNGQFVIVVATLLMIAAACSWRDKLIKIFLILALFFMLLMPWYLRNYQLTGQWFYCPMLGPVLQSFCVPKIDRYLTGRSFEECWKVAMIAANRALQEETARIAAEEPYHKVSRELVCKKVAMSQIFAHPFVFAWEWLRECGKTTFDLNGSQIVAMENKTHSYDPLEEFLLEKYAMIFYKQSMPWYVRLIMYSEAVLSLLLWIGILLGLYYFMLIPIIKNFNVSSYQYAMWFVWLKAGFMVASLIAMTGGFGYARLRLPMDPLLMILSLTAWYYLVHKKEVKA